MQAPPPERPSAVTAIAIFSIVLAVLFVLGALATLASAAGMRFMPAPGDVPAETRQMMALSAGGALPSAVLQILIAAVMLPSAVLLLRLRESGRRALELLNWFGVVYVVGSTLYALWRISAVSAGMPEVGANAPFSFSGIMFAGMIVWAAVQLAAIAVILWQLQTPAVREAMQQ